jgi:segregation and condensation protein B
MEQMEETAAETTEEEAREETYSEQFSIQDHSSAEDTLHSGLRAVIEAIVYITDEPLSALQIAAALQQPPEIVGKLLEELAAEYATPAHGLTIREIAGGYKMATKPEFHEHIRAFVKSLKPPMKLSLAALETLSVIAYKQPITAPEIMEIRGVQGAGVLKTLIDRKLIAPAGRKKVVGNPIVYKTTRDFLIQFGLNDLNELPTLKEFEELGRLAFVEQDEETATEDQPAEAQTTEAEDVEPHPPIHDPEPHPQPIHDPDPSEDTDPIEGPEKHPVKD